MIYLFGGISSLVTAQLVGKLADKYGKRQVFVIAAIVSLVFILMLTNLPRIPVYLVLIIFSIWFSAAMGRTVPGQAMTTQAVSAKTRGSFMSLNSCMQSLGTGFAGLLSGWLTFSDTNFAIHHYNYLGYLSVILILICIALAIRLDRLFVLNPIK